MKVTFFTTWGVSVNWGTCSLVKGGGGLSRMVGNVKKKKGSEKADDET